MNWIIIIAIAVISDALRIFIDNYASDVYFKEKGAVSQKIVSGLAYLIVGIVTLVINDFDITIVTPMTIGFLVLSGILSSIAGIPYFRALEIDDSTNIGIFFQFAPILYLIFGWAIGDEAFSFTQLIGAFIIIAAPILIVATAQKRSRKIRFTAAVLAFISIIFYVVSGELFVQVDTDSLGLFNEIGIVLIAKGLSDTIIIGGRRKWRHRLTKVIKSSHRKVLVPINAGVVMRVIQEFSYRIGLVVAPTVAIASAASDSVEPIAIFFIGIILTIIWPKFGREKLNKKTVSVHFIATALVAFGIILMQL